MLAEKTGRSVEQISKDTDRDNFMSVDAAVDWLHYRSGTDQSGSARLRLGRQGCASFQALPDAVIRIPFVSIACHDECEIAVICFFTVFFPSRLIRHVR